MSVYPTDDMTPDIRPLIGAHAEHVADHSAPVEHAKALRDITRAATWGRDTAPDEVTEELMTLIALLAGDETPVSKRQASDADLLRVIALASTELDPIKAGATLKNAIPSYTA